MSDVFDRIQAISISPTEVNCEEMLRAFVGGIQGYSFGEKMNESLEWELIVECLERAYNLSKIKK